MRIHRKPFRIFFRIDDQRFVIQDSIGIEVFEGTYSEVEAWLDRYDNGSEATAAAELLFLRSLGPVQRDRRC
ncbi:MAG: hypothetical protein ACR2NZ_21180 [Rubripirellula sp.]